MSTRCNDLRVGRLRRLAMAVDPHFVGALAGCSQRYNDPP